MEALDTIGVAAAVAILGVLHISAALEGATAWGWVLLPPAIWLAVLAMSMIAGPTERT